MGPLKEIEDDLKSTYSILTERGILSGFYFGIVFTVILLSIKEFTSYGNSLILLFAMSVFIGLIISNISYECLMPIFRHYSDKIVLKYAKKVIQETKPSEKSDEPKLLFRDYDDLRKFREKYLSNNEVPYKNQILTHLKLRQDLTYIASTNLAAILILIGLEFKFEPNSTEINLLLPILGITLISSGVGIFMRAKFLGKYIGYAQSDTFQTKS